MKFNELNQVAEQYNIGKGKDGWLVLETGDNKVRIVSEYEVLAKHWAGKKASVCVGKENGCIFCNVAEGQKPEKPVVKFLFWVIDRKDGKFKVAEVGWTVIKAIGDLQEDEEYSFDLLPDYDVNIKKTVKGSGTQPSDTEYTVIPSRTNKPLTPEEDKEFKELTSIKTIVENIKGKVLKEYQAMGLGEEDVPPPADGDAPQGE